MLRIVDANLNRLGEGLRVLEEIARFMLDDVKMSEKLKNMRHDLLVISPETHSRLLAARDSEGDVGRDIVVSSGSSREKVSDLVAANSKRAQEALRVLEEVVKLPEMPSDLAGREFEKARFSLYEIEKGLFLRLARHAMMEKLSGLYAIIDPQVLAGRVSEAEAARQVIEGGASVIQFRDKDRPRGELVPIARELKRICAQAQVLFIINDYVDLALAVDADGVHVGQTDLPLMVVRGILPLDKIIGCSANTVKQARKAEAEGADYLGVGAIYPTATKPDAGVVGLEGLRKIRAAVSLPIVALGGIDQNNAGEVIKSGADAVAAISAILKGDIEKSTRVLASKMAGGKNNEQD
ncbi:MAG: thiamine phosphate synthase [Dehalococcoidia bacterium]|nr:thiamine phosphate synthase [Dehalococcoidia bacterium]